MLLLLDVIKTHAIRISTNSYITSAVAVKCGVSMRKIEQEIMKNCFVLCSVNQMIHAVKKI